MFLRGRLVMSRPRVHGSRPVASDATLSQIDFPAALAVVAERCVSAPGRARLLARRPDTDADRIGESLSLVAELVDLIRDGDRFHALAIDDLTDELRELAVEGSVLEAPGLMAFGRALSAMGRIASDLERIGSEAPNVSALQTELPPPEVSQRLDRSFDPDGSLRDDASSDLKRARQSVRSTRKKLVQLLESLLRNIPDAGEGNVTVRNGRYVIPIRRTSKKPLSGIVHAESSSGATAFVEPQKAVSLGNELHAAESAEHRAELAVFRDLTVLLRASRTELENGWEMCVAVDDLCARARYSIETEGVRPSIVDAPSGIKIVGGRHPLLLAELDGVVPFEMEAAPDDRVILISGPNTGGKTVLLKGVGLFAALTQSGIIPPLKKGSVVPIFSTIVSDIGDHQSIADSLSTYGGHLTATRDLLEIADNRALVLIDELGTGTDPAEGAALAGALLQTLCLRGCFAMATTHLGQLKQIAADTPGVVNASLQFDPDKLEPTYRFLLGVPGRSYGLALAKRLGLPTDVLDRADALRTGTERSMEALLADLELREKDLDDREAAVAGTTDRLDAQADGLEILKIQLSEERGALDRAEREQEVKGREEARQYLLDARRRVEDALVLANAGGSEVSARKARKVVETGVQEEGAALDRLAEQAEKKGWRVKVGSAGRQKRTAVSPKRPVAKTAPRIVRRAATVPIPETAARTEVDLRGMNGDEAELVVQRALDDAVVEGLASLRIIHGKGTGALRERIRIVLGSDQRVASADQASNYEGGWGVTIAMLK